MPTDDAASAQRSEAPEAAAPTAAHDPHDPHDHSDHDHPPTGAEVVAALVRGLSIVALIIPALGILAVIGSLGHAPSSPFVLAVGLLLGILHLVVLVTTSLVVARRNARWAISPAVQAIRSALEELLRLAVVWIMVSAVPAEDPSRLGTWIGLGAALVWVLLATAQTVAARRRIARPGQWAEDAVATLLGGRVSVRRSMAMRVADVIGTIGFQIGATMLVAAAPIMVVPTTVLSFATAMSTLVLQRHPASERVHSPWAFAPLLIGLLALALGIFTAVQA